MFYTRKFVRERHLIETVPSASIQATPCRYGSHAGSGQDRDIYWGCRFACAGFLGESAANFTVDSQ